MAMLAKGSQFDSELRTFFFFSANSPDFHRCLLKFQKKSLMKKIEEIEFYAWYIKRTA